MYDCERGREKHKNKKPFRAYESLSNDHLSDALYGRVTTLREYRSGTRLKNLTASGRYCVKRFIMNVEASKYIAPRIFMTPEKNLLRMRVDVHTSLGEFSRY